MSAAKPYIIVYGNCQGGALSQALMDDPDITAEYSIFPASNFTIPGAEPAPVDPQIYKNCKYLLHQVASFIPEVPFLDQLPSTCQHIRFPVFWMKILWPLHAEEPRNKPEPGFEFGRFSYGDRIVQDMLKKGVPQNEIFKRYMEVDLNKYMNLDRFYEMSIEELYEIDANSDIGAAKYIEDNLKVRQLFFTINHCTNLLMSQIYFPLKSMILGKTFGVSQLGPKERLGLTEVPIHPTIIDHYQLKWIHKDYHYRYFGSRFTFQEYMERYICLGPVAPILPPAPYEGAARRLKKFLKRIKNKIS